MGTHISIIEAIGLSILTILVYAFIKTITDRKEK
jgi:hypothetical protein